MGEGNLHLQPAWQDYELIDSGDFRKLEPVGPYILNRQEPQAIWNARLPGEHWKKRAHAIYRRPDAQGRAGKALNEVWQMQEKVPPRWPLKYNGQNLSIKLEAGLTPFGHIGVFPEQVPNWEFIAQQLDSMEQGARVLNLFAYTGAASVAAGLKQADVVHVDSARPNINWAHQNAWLNSLNNVRWVLEDAFKFAEREVRRGNQYDGIILDPPPFGRGKKKGKWTLQEKLAPLLHTTEKLLRPKNSFLVLNTYASGLSSFAGYQICRNRFAGAAIEYGELGIEANSGNHLSCGHFVRLTR